MDRAARVGYNEAVFRDVNERIRALQNDFGTDAPTMDVVCECADEQCMARISILPSRYARVRAEPRLFIILPGHAVEEFEDVVEEHAGYQVVRKHEGKPGRIAEETAP